MKKIYLIPAVVCLLTALSFNLIAQTPFWSEDFSGGDIPAGWVNEDLSGQDAVWTWCAAPTTPVGAGCPPVFTGRQNFASATAANGFVTLNSDGYGELPNDHSSVLRTSAINTTGENEVYLRFQTEIGTFNHDANSTALLQTSTDLTTWTTYNIFPNWDNTGTAWSDNPAVITVDISASAANQAVVYIRWIWNSNYDYVWSIDDIELFDANPAPSSDIAMSEAFYPVSSFATPESQIATDSFGFSALLSNNGNQPATNIVLKVSVVDINDNVEYTDSILIPELAPGVLDSFFALDGLYAPELSEGTYFIDYVVYADSADALPNDNVESYPFVVTTNIFAKENGPETATRPAAAGDWAIGNFYRMNSANLEQYEAREAIISFATNASLPITGVSATVYLFKISDDVEDDFSNFDNADLISTSFEWVGLGSHQNGDTSANFDLVTVPLLDFSTNEFGVPLEPGGRYFLVVSLEGANSAVFMAYGSIVQPQFVSTVVYTTQWFLGGFGPEINAVARMVIDLVSTTDNVALPENSMQIFPNPVNDQLSLHMNFDAPTTATFTIAELSGRVIDIQDRQNLTNETVRFNVATLPAGTYLARVATANGTLTKRFVVVR